MVTQIKTLLIIIVRVMNWFVGLFCCILEEYLNHIPSCHEFVNSVWSYLFRCLVFCMLSISILL